MADRATLEELVPLVYPWATGVAYLLCRDRQQAQDLVQDALVQAVRRPPEPLDIATLRAWLRTVIFRLYLRRRARARREAAALLRWGRERPAQPTLTGPTDEIVAALGQLSRRQRACAVLRYLEDLSEQDVARLLGIRHGTVKAHLAAARERLRHSLGTAPAAPDPAASDPRPADLPM